MQVDDENVEMVNTNINNTIQINNNRVPESGNTGLIAQETTSVNPGAYSDNFGDARALYKVRESDSGMMVIPDIINYQSDTSSDLQKYLFTETAKEFRPVFYNNRKSLKFTIYSEGFIHPSQFKLNIQVENENPNNYLQLDSSPHSFIKNIRFTHDGVELENIKNYDIILSVLNDINYLNNKYNMNKGAPSPYSMSSREDLIHPKEYGTHIIFNPPQTSFDYMDCAEVNGGVLDFKPVNKKTFEFNIFSYIFGNCTKEIKLIPLFLFRRGLVIDIDLNEHCFFVPVFNAKIQDLINANINNVEYSVYRNFLSELKNAKNFAKTLVVNQTPMELESMSNQVNKQLARINTLGNGNCLFEALSLGLYNDLSKATELRIQIVNFMKEHQDQFMNIVKIQENLNQDVYEDPIFDDNASYTVLKDFINKKKPLKIEMAEKINEPDTKIFDGYLDLVIREGKFGGRPEIIACSKLYNIPIEIYTLEEKNGNKINYIFKELIGMGSSGKLLKLLLTFGKKNEFHYDLLVDQDRENSQRFAEWNKGLLFEPTDFFDYDRVLQYIDYYQKDNLEFNISKLESILDLVNWDLLVTYFLKKIDEFSKMGYSEEQVDKTSIDFIRKKLPGFFIKNISDVDDLIIKYIKKSNIEDLKNLVNIEFFDNFATGIDFLIYRPFVDEFNRSLLWYIFNNKQILNDYYNGKVIKLSNYVNNVYGNGSSPDAKILQKNGDSINVVEIDGLRKLMINMIKTGDPNFLYDRLFFDGSNGGTYQNNYKLKFSDEVPEPNEEQRKNKIVPDKVFNLLSFANMETYIQQLEQMSMIVPWKNLLYSNLTNIEDQSLFKLNDLFRAKEYVGPILNLLKAKSILIRDKFLKKINTLFGPKQSVQIIKKYIPTMILAKYEAKFERYLKSNDYWNCIELISKDFLSQFDGSLGVEKMKSFNPFNIDKKIDEIKVPIERLLKRMIKNGSDFAHFNFSLVPSNNYIFPVTGVISKMLLNINQNPDIVLGDTRYEAFFKMQPFEILVEWAELSENTDNIHGGSNIHFNVINRLKDPLIGLASSLYNELNSQQQANLLRNINETIRRKLEHQKKLVEVIATTNVNFAYEGVLESVLTSFVNCYGVKSKYIYSSVIDTYGYKLGNEASLAVGTYVANNKLLSYYNKNDNKITQPLIDNTVKCVSQAILSIVDEIKDPRNAYCIPFNEIIKNLFENKVCFPNTLKFTKADFPTNGLTRLYYELFTSESFVLAEKNRVNSMVLHIKTIAEKDVNNFKEIMDSMLLVNNSKTTISTNESEIKNAQAKLNETYGKINVLISSKSINNKTANYLHSTITKMVSRAEDGERIKLKAELANIDDEIKKQEAAITKLEGEIVATRDEIKKKEKENSDNRKKEALVKAQKKIEEFKRINKIDSLDDFFIKDSLVTLKKNDKDSLLGNLNVQKALLDEIHKVIQDPTQKLKSRSFFNFLTDNAQSKYEEFISDYVKITNEFNKIITESITSFSPLKENEYLVIKQVQNTQHLYDTNLASDIDPEWLIDTNGRLFKIDPTKDSFKLYFTYSNDSRNLSDENLRNIVNSLAKEIAEGKKDLSKFTTINNTTHFVNAPLAGNSIIFENVIKPKLNNILLRAFAWVISKQPKQSFMINLLSEVKATINANTSVSKFWNSVITFMGDEEFINQLYNAMASSNYKKENIKKLTDNIPFLITKFVFSSLYQMLQPKDFFFKLKEKGGLNLIHSFLTTAGLTDFIENNGPTVCTYMTPSYSQEYKISSSGKIANVFKFYVIKKMDERTDIGNKIQQQQIKKYDIVTSLDYVLNVVNNSFKMLESISFKNIGVYGSILTSFIHILEVLARHLDDKLNIILFIEIVPLFASLVHNINRQKVITKIDMLNIVTLADSLNEKVKQYNLTHGTKYRTFADSLVDFKNPETFIDISRQIEDNYPDFLKDNLQRQSNFEILNEEANIQQQLDISRAYKLEYCSLKINEINFNDPSLRGQIQQSGFRLRVTKFDIVDHQLFNTVPPSKIINNFYQANVKNLFQIIINAAYLKSPAYRKYSRYSRNINTYGIEVDNVKYPQNFIKGNTGSSKLNIPFLTELDKCFSISSSSINKLNYSLDVGTSMYIAKKLSSYPDINLFSFDSAKTDLHLNLVFGHYQDMIGKCIFGINFDYMQSKLGRSINISSRNISFIMESDLQIDNQDTFALYELLTFLEYDQIIEINNLGFIQY
jgi:cell division protein FtsB